jgi:hypothetical protein
VNGSLHNRPIAVRSNVHVPSSARMPAADPRVQSAAGRSRQVPFWAGVQGVVAGQATTFAPSAPTFAPPAVDSSSRSVSRSTRAPSGTVRSIPTAASLSTCPAPPLVAMASPGTCGGGGVAGTSGRSGLPAGSSSAGPWSRFHHPSCAAVPRLSAAPAGTTGAATSSNRATTRPRDANRMITPGRIPVGHL